MKLISDLDGYGNLPEDIKNILGTHRLKYSSQMGKDKEKIIDGFYCLNCGICFTIIDDARIFIPKLDATNIRYYQLNSFTKLNGMFVNCDFSSNN